MKTLLFAQINIQRFRESLEYACFLTKSLHYNLKLIHIHYPEIMFTSSRIVDMEMFQTPDNNSEVENAERCLQELKNEKKIDCDLNFEYYTGTPLDILGSMYKKGLFDMLILQNEDSGNPYQSIKNIIRTLNCPIWIIPREIKPSPIKKILYTTDYQPGDIAAIKQAVSLLNSKIDDLTIIHLITEKRNFHQEIKQIGFETLLKEETKASGIKCITREAHEKKSISEIMSNLLIQEGCDLIVALKENKNIFQKIFFRSFTSKMLKDFNYPVLILHRQKSVE